MITKHINVIGIVQGVCFRASTKQKADELGIFGTVRNCKCDRNTVKIHAQGSEESMEQFIAWCHEGPEDAVVEKVEVIDDKKTGTDSFEITE